MTIFNRAYRLDETDEVLILQAISSLAKIYLGTFSSLYLLSVCLSFIPNTISVPEFCSTFSGFGTPISWQWFVCVCARACACCVTLLRLRLTVRIKRRGGGGGEDDVARRPQREPGWRRPRCERRANESLSRGAVIKFSQSADNRRAER